MKRIFDCRLSRLILCRTQLTAPVLSPCVTIAILISFFRKKSDILFSKHRFCVIFVKSLWFILSKVLCQLCFGKRPIQNNNLSRLVFKVFSQTEEIPHRMSQIIFFTLILRWSWCFRFYTRRSTHRVLLSHGSLRFASFTRRGDILEHIAVVRYIKTVFSDEN